MRSFVWNAVALAGALVLAVAFDVKSASIEHLWFGVGTAMVAVGSFMMGRNSR